MRPGPLIGIRLIVPARPRKQRPTSRYHQTLLQTSALQGVWPTATLMARRVHSTFDAYVIRVNSATCIRPSNGTPLSSTPVPDISTRYMVFSSNTVTWW